MKFSLNRELFKELIFKMSFLLLFLLIFLLFDGDYLLISIIIIALIVVLISDIILLRKINKYKKENDSNYINELEKTLENTKFIYDGWYITDNYMFSICKLKKIDYKDIEIVESGLSLTGVQGSSISWKQTIYLKDGTKFKIKSLISSNDLEKFEEIVKNNNRNVYFVIIEDYKKLQNIKKKKI